MLRRTTAALVAAAAVATVGFATAGSAEASVRVCKPARCTADLIPPPINTHLIPPPINTHLAGSHSQDWIPSTKMS